MHASFSRIINFLKYFYFLYIHFMHILVITGRNFISLKMILND